MISASIFYGYVKHGISDLKEILDDINGYIHNNNNLLFEKLGSDCSDSYFLAISESIIKTDWDLSCQTFDPYHFIVLPDWNKRLELFSSKLNVKFSLPKPKWWLVAQD